METFYKLHASSWKWIHSCNREQHAELHCVSYYTIVYDITLRYGHPACAVKAQFTYGAIERRRDRLTLYGFRRGKALYPCRDIEVGWRSSLSRQTTREAVIERETQKLDGGTVHGRDTIVFQSSKDAKR